MDRGTPPPQGTTQGNPAIDPGPGARPRATPEAPCGPALGKALVQTSRHFFPNLNTWLDRVSDGRDQEAIIYEGRFLIWWGIALYLLQLGSRRQLDFDLDARGTCVLANLNRLAGTAHDTRPVHDTLDYFLEHSRPQALADLQTQMIQRLLRMKALDAARLLGKFVVIFDGTGLLCWRRRHCDQCLVQRHEHTTLYMHKVLEAKLVGPAGVVLSVGSEFIENGDLAGSRGKDAERVKQDCELKAFSRLAPELKKTFPQLQIVIAGDSLFACGRVLQLAKENNWAYVLTFKKGHMPAVWAEFERLLPLCPDNRLEFQTPEGERQVYRWVRDLSYVDDEGRSWCFHAIECRVKLPNGEEKYFAWITNLHVSAASVIDIATKGGRDRWKIENEGFNRQKNSGLNLEHVYSTDPEKWKAYYYLLQIAFILIQLLERGSLLRRLAASCGQTVQEWFGALKNIPRRLLESLRCCLWPDDCYDVAAAAELRIGLDDSS